MPIARNLFKESKKLRVFDLDDTLITTDSFIYITHSNGQKSKLTPAQYATYVPKPGDTYDFSDFEKVKNPKIIKGVFELLKRMAEKDKGDRGVYILTARSAYKPVYDFIRQSGIKGVNVIAVGDNNPEKKADWIEQQIRDEGYDDVFFIDDSLKNIHAVRNRLKKYPNVKQKIQHIKHD
jgi:FMN phosphatase YigB (HAD superfamily)